MSVDLRYNGEKHHAYQAHWRECSECSRKLNAAWDDPKRGYSVALTDAKYADDLVEAAFEHDVHCNKGLKLFYESIEGPWRNGAEK